jgi:Tol biopolymer transport system component
LRRIGRILIGGLAAFVAFGGSASAAYPGANGVVAFTSTQDGGARHIFVTTATGIQDLTGLGSPYADTGPEFSPDGQQIAFTRGGGGLPNSEVFVMGASGESPHALTNSPTGAADPTWSPDGKRIAFIGIGPNTIPDIWVMNADGSHAKQITNDAASESELAWSPRGDRLAFVGVPAGGGDRDIYTINPDGTGRIDLTNDPTSFDLNPDYSPDGSQIVYSGPHHPKGSVGGDLWIMGADGSGPHPLEHESNGYSDGDFPAWSPDGTTIAFAANNGSGYYHVWSIPVGGGENSPLVANAIPGGNPGDQEVDWQPLVPLANITGAKVAKHKGKASFRFTLSGSATSARCALARKRHQARFTECSSPQAYHHLKPGHYTFEVVAVSSTGQSPAPATRAFTIK